MNLLVTYDVKTETKEGRRRLRRVAKVCESYGQRVQLSVFECSVSQMLLQKLRADLLDIIDPEEDRLRIYRLQGNRDEIVESYGIDGYVDFDKPLVV